jgi:fructose-1,6-bisphosphatase
LQLKHATKEFSSPHVSPRFVQDDGKWVHVKETTEIGEGKLFAPGNLRATFDNPEYEKLVSYWLGEKYTLRYTGGMVPDVFQIIVKERGMLSLHPIPARQFNAKGDLESTSKCLTLCL